MGWKSHQMDVETTFLNGLIEEEVYIEQPQGFEIHEGDSCLQTEENLVWTQAGTSSLVFSN